MTPQLPDARDLIDLATYPLDGSNPKRLDKVIAATRARLEDDGCAVLAGFIRRERMAGLVAEAERVAPFAHASRDRVNAYFTGDDETLPRDHPRRRYYERSNAFVPADNFGADSGLRAIYEWPPFADFIQRCLDEREFYRYADPLADVIINVVEPGGGFPWHFDTNTYTVTLAIQNGEGGGLFEYCPNLRDGEDENYAGVAAVLNGERDMVRTLRLKPGDLQLFKGRYSLHRVSPVTGAKPRHVAIFSFASEAGMVGRLARTRQLYGRVLPIHEAREKAVRGDGLAD